CCCLFFFSSRRRHTRFSRDWSSDVCSSDLAGLIAPGLLLRGPATLRRGLLLSGAIAAVLGALAAGLAGGEVARAATSRLRLLGEIGRASCRERGQMASESGW